MSQAKSCLAGVNAGAEQFEFKYCFELTVFGWGGRLSTEASLPDAGIKITVGRKLIPEGRQLHGTNSVEPVGIRLLELVTHIKHRKSVNRKGALTLSLLRSRPRCRRSGGSGRRR